MITAADVKLLRNQVSAAIDTLEPQLVISDEDHTIAREIIAELPAVFEGMSNGEIPSAEHIARVALTSCKDIQFRDYLMGLFTEFDNTTVGAYLEIVSNSVKKDHVYAVATVLSTYYFRQDDEGKAEAVDTIKEILEFKPEYSLAKLLNRVYSIAGGDLFTQMAGELHPKVKANILEEGDNN